MLKKIIRVLIAAFTLVVGINAHAAAFSIGGLNFNANFPEGYCSVNSAQSPRDMFMQDYLKRALGKSLRIKALGVPCGELSSYRQGKAHLSGHFITVTQVGVDGNFGRFLLGHSVYAALISSFDTSDLSRFESRTTGKLAQYHDTVSNLLASMIGIHDRASYFAGTGRITNADGLPDYALHVYGGSALVHKYPLAVFYVTSDDNEAQAEALAKVSQVLEGL